LFLYFLLLFRNFVCLNHLLWYVLSLLLWYIGWLRQLTVSGFSSWAGQWLCWQHSIFYSKDGPCQVILLSVSCCFSERQPTLLFIISKEAPVLYFSSLWY
jgi:hypothetical protein